MVFAKRLITIPTALLVLFTTSPGTAQPTETPTSLAPQLCHQLGGPLPCQIAQPGPWIYKYGDMTFKSEAKVYEHMLDAYGPTSVFALAHRWGKTNPDPGAPERVRSIETTSWKMYYRECSGRAEGQCEEFPRYVGYQRVRDVTCPAGYQFSSNAASPYCLPADAARAIAQTTSAAGSMLSTRALARSTLPR